MLPRNNTLPEWNSGLVSNTTSELVVTEEAALAATRIQSILLPYPLWLILLMICAISMLLTVSGNSFLH